VSAAALGGLQPIAAAGAGGGEPVAASTATAAGERVQQLHALLAELEHGPATGVGGTSNTFASALDAAQAGGESSAATAGAYPSSEPFAGAASATPTADAYVAPAPTSDAAYTSLLPADGYTSATPTANAYTTSATSDIPTTVAYTAAPVGAGAAGESSAYTPLIEQAAARNGLNPAILSGLIQQESGFDPSARSSAGALGLTQLMPSTAASLGVAEPLDPAQSIEGGARYLSQLLHQFAGNTADALAAYNAGPGAVQQYGGVPPYSETQQYVTKVLGYAAAYSQSGVGGSPYTDTTAPASTGPATTPEVVV
jgi:soluble lytic murein transglycosylase-like protein